MENEKRLFQHVQGLERNKKKNALNRILLGEINAFRSIETEFELFFTRVQCPRR